MSNSTGGVGDRDERRHLVDGGQLLEYWVSEGLNGHNADAIAKCFSAIFIEHNPFRVPNYFNTPEVSRRGTTHLLSVVKFLSLPVVDVKFSIEDAFESDGRVGYRLFAEGSVRVLPSNTDLTRSGKGLVHGKVISGSTYDGLRQNWETLLGDRRHMAIEAIGIYRIVNNKFVEHWEASSPLE